MMWLVHIRLVVPCSEDAAHALGGVWKAAPQDDADVGYGARSVRPTYCYRRPAVKS